MTERISFLYNTKTVVTNRKLPSRYSSHARQYPGSPTSNMSILLVFLWVCDLNTGYCMKRFIHHNSLTIVFIFLFLLSLGGQFVTGYHEHNKERQEEGMSLLSAGEYLQSGHFIQATFENWESEFLQMALFVVLTISLRQKGSSESKKLEGKEEVDREPSGNRPGAPWPVRRGGWVLFLYKHSLSLILVLLFIASLILHFRGSMLDENELRAHKGLPPENISGYLADSRFWFESFQNWQSEFLSVAAIVVLSIYFRQKGSPQSKPVDAAHTETGE